MKLRTSSAINTRHSIKTDEGCTSSSQAWRDIGKNRRVSCWDSRGSWRLCHWSCDVRRARYAEPLDCMYQFAVWSAASQQARAQHHQGATEWNKKECLFYLYQGGKQFSTPKSSNIFIHHEENKLSQLRLFTVFLAGYVSAVPEAVCTFVSASLWGHEACLRKPLTHRCHFYHCCLWLKKPSPHTSPLV